MFAGIPFALAGIAALFWWAGRMWDYYMTLSPWQASVFIGGTLLASLAYYQVVALIL